MELVCLNCHHKNEGGKFCVKCGTKLPVIEVQQQPQPQYQSPQPAPLYVPAQAIEQPQQEMQQSQPQMQSQQQAQQYQYPTYQQGVMPPAPQAPPSQAPASHASVPQVPVPQATMSQAPMSQGSVYTYEPVLAPKQSSNMHVNFLKAVMKNPYQAVQQVNKNFFVQALITIALFAVLVPLTLYAALHEYAENFTDSPFMDIVVKQSLAYFLFMLIVGSIVFLAVMLGRSTAGYTEVIAKFGIMLTPFVAVLVVALLMSILEFESFVYVLSVALLGALFVVPTLLIVNYREAGRGGLDALYGTMLSVVGTLIAMKLMGEVMKDTLMQLDSFPF